MIKHYLFLSNLPINRSYFHDAIESLEIPFEISYLNDCSGDIISDHKFFTKVDQILMPMHDDMGLTVSVLCSHEDSAFAQKLLHESLAYFPNQALFLSDVLMKEMSFGDYSSMPMLSSLFKEVPHEVLSTAGMYLRCGLDASLAADKLYIHRNTFNYRLNQFIEQTRLDIRDYHNALLLELYFQLAAR